MAGDGCRGLSVKEAMTRAERSEATVRRALRHGQLPGARRGPDGRWLIPIADVRASLLPQASELRAVGRSYARSILWAHAKILDWGRSIGWEIPDFARDVNALTPHDDVVRKKPDTQLRRPLSVAEIARVASHLHVVHQLVLWLMRVLGLRISEAFGPHVGDIVDFGEVGLAVIHRQGGRPFLTRTRTGVETTHSKGTLKRAASYRVIVIPGTLMAALRVAVETFHTDPTTGVVDLGARLVPWIAREGGGQSGFRSALGAALRKEGFDMNTRASRSPLMICASLWPPTSPGTESWTSWPSGGSWATRRATTSSRVSTRWTTPRWLRSSRWPMSWRRTSPPRSAP